MRHYHRKDDDDEQYGSCLTIWISNNIYNAQIVVSAVISLGWRRDR